MEQDPIQQILDRHSVSTDSVVCGCQLGDDQIDSFTKSCRQALKRRLDKAFAKLRWL